MQAKTTSSEFDEWIEYLQHHHERQDFYAAQIALEVRRGWAKDPDKYKVDDFLFTFGTSSNGKASGSVDVSKMDEEQKKAYRRHLSEQGLALWGALTGWTKSKKTKEP